MTFAAEHYWSTRQTPASVLPMLIRSARCYLRRYRSSPDICATVLWLDSQIDAVADQLLDAGGPPAQFTAAQATAYLHGFHDQWAQFRCNPDYLAARNNSHICSATLKAAYDPAAERERAAARSVLSATAASGQSPAHNAAAEVDQFDGPVASLTGEGQAALSANPGQSNPSRPRGQQWSANPNIGIVEDIVDGARRLFQLVRH